MKQHVNPLKKTYLHLEALFNTAFGERWNPFYHLGPLAFWLFWIVLVTGIYLLFIFDTGITKAYDSVEYITNEQWWLAGIARSLHRYASDGAILVVMLHVFRELALDRYRGFRWYSWFTGIPTLWMIVLLGITGYWLVWDQLAQYVAIGSSRMLEALPMFSESMSRNFLEGQLSDRFFTLMGFLHLLGQPLFLMFMMWFHVRRLAHVEITAPKGLAVGTLIGLLILALIKPAVSHGPADLTHVPMTLHLDWFYLNIFPVLDAWGGAKTWMLAIGISTALWLMPWIPPKKTGHEAVVNLDHCNGCGQCAEDCPFDAITMQARTDGKRYEQEPVVLPHLCAACGICVGSCVSSNPFRRSDKELLTGIDMPQYPIDGIRNKVRETLDGIDAAHKILVFNCKNAFDLEEFKAPDIGIVKLFCIGQLPAAMVDFALKNGASGVLVLSCRPGDCYYRFGNIWLDERFSGVRKPVLRSGVDRARMDFVGASETDSGKVEERLKELRAAVLNYTPESTASPASQEEEEAAHG